MIVERWRPIPGFVYEASSQGRIRRAAPGKNTRPGRVLRPVVGTGGYLRLRLMQDGRSIDREVHVLVCAAFHGPKPGSRYEVDHIDGDQRNNRAGNLQWVTKSRNNALAFARGRRFAGAVPAYGQDNVNARLTPDQVREIRAKYLRGRYGAPRLAREYGVSTPTIQQIVRRGTWKHVA